MQNLAKIKSSSAEDAPLTVAIIESYMYQLLQIEVGVNPGKPKGVAINRVKATTPPVTPNRVEMKLGQMSGVAFICATPRQLLQIRVAQIRLSGPY